MEKTANVNTKNKTKFRDTYNLIAYVYRYKHILKFIKNKCQIRGKFIASQKTLRQTGNASYIQEKNKKFMHNIGMTTLVFFIVFAQRFTSRISPFTSPGAICLINFNNSGG